MKDPLDQPLPEEWASAIARGNAQAELVRITTREMTVAVQYQLPLHVHFPPTSGRFTMDFPAGSTFSGAKLVRDPLASGPTVTRPAFLGLTWDLPKLRIPGTTNTRVILWPSHDEAPAPPAGFFRRMVGRFHWRGSWSVYAEDPLRK